MILKENEAIKWIKSFKNVYRSIPKQTKEACETAIKALEEIQEYRKIGTVEELKAAQKYIELAKKHGTMGKVIDACAEYESIGTVEECREAKEKSDPIEPQIIEVETGTKYLTCPKCKLTTVIYNDMIVGYCPKCGQRLENK